MSQEPSPETRNNAGTVIHLLPADMARGAQAYARTLADSFGESGDRHLVVTIFEGGPGVASPDTKLGVRPGLGRRIGFDPRAVWRLRRLIGAIRPAVVVAHGGEPAKYAAAAIDPGQPLVYVMIGSLHQRLANPLRRMIHRRYVHRANAVVAVSEALGNEAVEVHGVPRERVVVIPNGRDVGRYQPGLGSGDDGEITVVFVGHLDERKRPDLFLDVVDEVRARGHTVTARIVGDGPMASRLRARADAATEILGSRSDVPEILAAADVLVFTGRPPEGMPGVLIEAGLSGLPVVTTDVPGAADVVADGETGFVVDVNDAAGLADRLERLVADPGLRKAMGSAARDRCVRLYSIGGTEAAWRGLLNDVAAR